MGTFFRKLRYEIEEFLLLLRQGASYIDRVGSYTLEAIRSNLNDPDVLLTIVWIVVYVLACLY